MSTEPVPAADNGTPPPSDIDLLRGEVAAETPTRPDLPEGAVVVPLHNRAGTVVADLAVLHPDDWPSSANEDVNTQRYFSWALKALAENDRAVWKRIDPLNREVVRFINDWAALAGENPGEGAGSQGS